MAPPNICQSIPSIFTSDGKQALSNGSPTLLHWQYTHFNILPSLTLRETFSLAYATMLD